MTSTDSCLGSAGQEDDSAIQHIAEMVVTSALIPPLAIFWRVWGALKFRVLFL